MKSIRTLSIAAITALLLGTIAACIPPQSDDSGTSGKPDETANDSSNSQQAVAAADSTGQDAAPPEILPAPPAPIDWPMWGGTPARNMATDTEVSLFFDLQKGAEGGVLWQQNLGSQTYGNPIVAGGKVFVGTNNGGGWRADKYPAQEDKGVVLAFNEADGKFLWQLTRDKLPAGRVNDWLLQGICSVPAVQGERMYVVTNRCELLCLDTEGFLDDENDGPVTDEVDATKQDADIIWNLDMIEELGVFPHNLATSSPVIHGDLIYLLTSNGVDEAHLDVPSPRSPCFLAVNKNTGEVAWEHNQPEDRILHGQWSSPALGKVNGKTQVYFPGGDGVLYAHDAVTGDEVWRFDLNPKETKWELYGKGTRNAVISTPVFYENSVILAVGQDPEHGEGVGHLWRIDATKTGDISPELGEIGSPGKPNPNSGVIWHYGGEIEGEDGQPEAQFRRTMSTVSIYKGMAFAADLSGFLHCIDVATGKPYWIHDLLDGIWGSTMAVDDKVFLGGEGGVLTVFKASKEKAEILAVKDTVEFSAIYSTPTFIGDRMYLSDRTRLYVVDVKLEREKLLAEELVKQTASLGDLKASVEAFKKDMDPEDKDQAKQAKKLDRSLKKAMQNVEALKQMRRK